MRFDGLLKICQALCVFFPFDSNLSQFDNMISIFKEKSQGLLYGIQYIKCENGKGENGLKVNAGIQTRDNTTNVAVKEVERSQESGVPDTVHSKVHEKVGIALGFQQRGSCACLELIRSSI